MRISGHMSCRGEVDTTAHRRGLGQTAAMSSTDETFGYSHHPNPTTSAAEPPSLQRRREVTHRAGRAEATAVSADAETLTRELQQLQSVTDTALAHLALPDLLAELLVRLRSLVEVDDVAILLPEEDGQHL